MENSDVVVNLSKNQARKLRKKLEWESNREERAAIRREKAKKRKERLKKLYEEGKLEIPAKKIKLEQTFSDMTVLIDMNFEDLMLDSEIKSLATQLSRCYSKNRCDARPCKLVTFGIGKRIKQHLEKLTYENWKTFMVFDERSSFEEVYAKDKIIYLSADAEDTIENLDEDKIYVIGGLIDKNRHKGICEDKAKAMGIKTAKLPIDKYIELDGRKVLTVNHVFEIIMEYQKEKDWEKAFREIIPPRKIKGSGTAKKTRILEREKL
jgi:tRNA (guanine9-N1)-methyltransferase